MDDDDDDDDDDIFFPLMLTIFETIKRSACAISVTI
jgi:hypothetical protein